MVSTTSAYAASIISSYLNVTSAISRHSTFSLFAERISLRIFSWFDATFSFGFSLSCLSICCSSYSFSARVLAMSLSSSSADLMLVLQLTMMALFYLYFR